MRNYDKVIIVMSVVVSFCLSGTSLLAKETSTPPSLADSDLLVGASWTALDFYGLLRRSHSNFEPMKSIEEMQETSDLVVRGRVASISQGRTIGAPTGSLSGLHTFIIKFEISEVLSGEADKKRVHVEMIRGLPTEIDELEYKKPSDEMTLYLVKAKRFKVNSNVKVYDEDEGLPDKKTKRYLLNTPQGMVVHSDAGDVQPLIETEYWIVND